MTNNGTRSRADRHLKRRNNKRKLLFFSFLGIVFIIVLLSLITFGNKEKKTNEELAEEEQQEELTIEDDNENELNETDTVDAEDEDVYELESDIDVQQVDSADDNVIVAFTGNWPPIGTVQEGPHTTDYNDGSADRKEIRQAVSAITGIEEKDITEHWVGNDGEQKVTATVSSKKNDEVYRVYLSWIDGEGWQVTKVERLKEYKKQ